MKIKVSDYTANEIIKIMREYVDRTQFEFADDCNFNRISIQNYEQGTVNYTFETLVKIAKFYYFEITIESTAKTEQMINKY